MKRTAIALNHLISTRFRTDELAVIAFGREARTIDVGELAGLSPRMEQGTNLHHALLLAQRHLRRFPHATPVVLIVTDGEPTAHLDPSGEPFFFCPPHPQTIGLTVAELDHVSRMGTGHDLPPRRRPGSGDVHRPGGAPHRWSCRRPRCRRPRCRRRRRLPGGGAGAGSEPTRTTLTAVSGVVSGFTVIFLVIGIGYALGRSGTLGPTGTDVLSRLVFFVCTPALLFHALVTSDLRAVFSSTLVIAGGTALIIGVAYVLVARLWLHQVLN